MRTVQYTLLGQCAFTYYVLKDVINDGVPPTCVAIEDCSVDTDPFVGLHPVGNPPWWSEHQFYHYDWRDALKELCLQYSIRLIWKQRVLQSLPNSEALVVAGYACRIADCVIQRFWPWALNVHPSKLPRFRGPQPEAQAILHGECVSGVSIHGMTESFDNGSVYYQQEYSLPSHWNVGDMEALEATLAASGIRQLLSQYPSLEEQEISTADGSYHTWYPLHETLFISPEDEPLLIENKMRLRPEGYAYFTHGESVCFPIADRVSCPTNYLRTRRSQVSITSYVEKNLRTGELVEHTTNLNYGDNLRMA